MRKNKRLLGIVLFLLGHLVLYVVHDIELFSMDFILTVMSLSMITVGTIYGNI